MANGIAPIKNTSTFVAPREYIQVTKSDYITSKTSRIERFVNFLRRCVSIFSRKISVFTEDAKNMNDNVYFRCNINKSMKFYREAITIPDDIKSNVINDLTIEETQQLAIANFNKSLDLAKPEGYQTLTTTVPLYIECTEDKHLNYNDFIKNYIITLDACIRLAKKEGVIDKNTTIKVVLNNAKATKNVNVALNSLNTTKFAEQSVIEKTNKIIGKVLSQRHIEKSNNVPLHGVNDPTAVEQYEAPKNADDFMAEAELAIQENTRNRATQQLSSRLATTERIESEDKNPSHSQNPQNLVDLHENHEQSPSIIPQAEIDETKYNNVSTQNVQPAKRTATEQQIEDSLDDYEQIKEMVADILDKLDHLQKQPIDDKAKKELESELGQEKVKVGEFHVTPGFIEHTDKLNLSNGYIMNAANPEGLNGSGVTGAIYKQASGKNHKPKEITKEFQQKLEDNPAIARKNTNGDVIKTTFSNNRELALGQIVTTKPLELEEQGVKGIIHAVAPKDEFSTKSNRTLYIACLANSFKKAMLFAAEKDNTDYLAMVLLGAGIYGGKPIDALIAAKIASELLKDNSKVNNLDMRMICYKQVGDKLQQDILALKSIDNLYTYV